MTSKKNNMDQHTVVHGLVITRIFDAPRECVWKAWSEPKQVMRWWGPRIFISPSCKVDFRVGGKYLFCMKSDSGPETWKKGLWTTGVYIEIKSMEKIVCTHSLSDENGNLVPTNHNGMEGMPSGHELTLTFEETKEGKTKMTLLHVGISDEMKEMCKNGWNESFDKLADSLTNT